MGTHALSSTHPRALRFTRDGMSLYGVELSLSYSNFQPRPENHGIRLGISLKNNAAEGFFELSQTETVFDLPSSSFSQKTTIPYRFDHPQIIQFRAERIKDDSLIVTGSEGIIEEPLAALVCSPVPHHLQFPAGLLISVQIRIPPSNNDYLRLRFVGEHLKPYNNFSLAAYFLVVIVSEERTFLLYKSEAIRSKEAKWASFRVPIQPLESGASLQVHVMNENTNNRDSLIGYFVTSTTQLMRGGNHNTYMLMDSSGARRSEKLLLQLKSVERDSGPSFFDVMRSGCDLRPSISIDFTASNGSPIDPNALHYIHPHAGNAYLDSIVANFSPIHLHMRDQRVSLLGFGAKVGPRMEMNNCFQLDPSSEHVLGLRGVIETYRRASLALQPFGPTQYADVIYHTSKFAKASVRLNMNAFYLQVIFTDGCSNLSPRVVDALVDASFSPMAVIFVLVGSRRDGREKEAENVRVLQNHPLKHSDGRVAPRQVSLVLSENPCEDGLGLIPLMISQWKNMTEAIA